METQLQETESRPARQSWDQLDNEPLAAYNRFLAYRNLGPSRTMMRAAMSLEYDQTIPKETKTYRLSSQWKNDSQQYHWVARAEAYDNWRLIDAANRAHAATIELFTRIAARGIEAVEGCELPKSWQDVLTYFKTVAEYVPQKTSNPDTSTVEAVADQHPLRAIGGN